MGKAPSRVFPLDSFSLRNLNPKHVRFLNYRTPYRATPPPEGLPPSRNWRSGPPFFDHFGDHFWSVRFSAFRECASTVIRCLSSFILLFSFSINLRSCCACAAFRERISIVFRVSLELMLGVFVHVPVSCLAFSDCARCWLQCHVGACFLCVPSGAVAQRPVK